MGVRSGPVPASAGPAGAGPSGWRAAKGAPPRQSLSRASLLLAPGLALANVLGYALSVLLSRWLGPSHYGAFGSLLGLSLIGVVPALALQPVVARHTALGTSSGRIDRAVLRAALWVGAGLTALAFAAAPALTAFIHLDSALPAVWLALALAPAPAVMVCQGLLQGAERFRALTVLYVAFALARLMGAAALVLLGYGVAGAMAGIALGSLAGAVVGVLLVRPAGTRTATLPGSFRRELVQACIALLGLLVLANIDVLLARHYLPAHDSGLYAVGSVVEKVSFWGPQFVGVVAFPRLADTTQRAGLLLRAMLVVGAFGVVVIGGAALLARPLLRFFVGAHYVGLAPNAWVFAAAGAALALAQLLLFSGIATADGRMSLSVAFVAAIEVIVIATAAHGSVRQIAAVVLACALGLTALGLGLQGRRR